MSISGLKEVILKEAFLDMNPNNTGNKHCLELKITYAMSPSESQVTEETFPLPIWDMSNFLLNSVGCQTFEALQYKLLNDIVICHFIFNDGKIVAFYNPNLEDNEAVYDIHYHRQKSMKEIYKMYHL